MCPTVFSLQTRIRPSVSSRSLLALRRFRGETQLFALACRSALEFLLFPRQ